MKHRKLSFILPFPLPEGLHCCTYIFTAQLFFAVQFLYLIRTLFMKCTTLSNGCALNFVKSCISPKSQYLNLFFSFIPFSYKWFQNQWSGFHSGCHLQIEITGWHSEAFLKPSNIGNNQCRVGITLSITFNKDLIVNSHLCEN